MLKLRSSRWSKRQHRASRKHHTICHTVSVSPLKPPVPLPQTKLRHYRGRESGLASTVAPATPRAKRNICRRCAARPLQHSTAFTCHWCSTVSLHTVTMVNPELNQAASHKHGIHQDDSRIEMACFGCFYKWLWQCSTLQHHGGSICTSP